MCGGGPLVCERDPAGFAHAVQRAYLTYLSGASYTMPRTIHSPCSPTAFLLCSHAGAGGAVFMDVSGAQLDVSGCVFDANAAAGAASPGGGGLAADLVPTAAALSGAATSRADLRGTPAWFPGVMRAGPLVSLRNRCEPPGVWACACVTMSSRRRHLRLVRMSQLPLHMADARPSKFSLAFKWV